MCPLRLYVKDKSKYDFFNNVNIYKKDLNITSYSDAIILPLKKINNPEKWQNYCGGVTDRKGEFITGLLRDKAENTFCTKAYKIDRNKIDYCNEEVIFGGVIIPNFGHFFLESLSRFWGINNDNSDKKIVFITDLENLSKDLPQWIYDFFELLDIDLSRIIVLKQPTQYKKVIVPEQSFNICGKSYTQYLSIIERIKSNVPDTTTHKKIYLTRSQFYKQDCLNESYFENFYERNGFEIIATEQLPLKEQLEILKNAEEIVCVNGTLAHLVLFCKNKVKLTILNRSDELCGLQAIINKITNVDCTYIDVHHNFLPTNHVSGSFILGPTEHWKDFLLESSYSYTEQDFYFDIEPFIQEYIKKWLLFYSQDSYFFLIKDYTISDLVQSLSREFLAKEVKKSKSMYMLSQSTIVSILKQCKTYIKIRYTICRFLKNFTFGTVRKKLSEGNKDLLAFKNSIEKSISQHRKID